MSLCGDLKLALWAAILVSAVSIACCGTIKLEDKDGLHLKPEEDPFEIFYRYFLESLKPPTVLHYAKHTLCKGQIGKFEVAMKQKLIMDEAFVKKFVQNLCEKKPPAMLKLWASELFDTDGDGYINDLEKRVTFETNNDD